MATITIRNLDERVKRALQVRAAINGRSMEAEARELIGELVGEANRDSAPEVDLGTAIHRRFAVLGGVDVEIPPRQFSGEPPQSRAGASASDAELEEGLGTAIQRLFAPLGGVELQIPTRRKSHRPVPTFEP